MEKHFVDYNQALALKELGFNESCLASWNFYTNEFNYNPYPSTFSSDDVIQLPLKSQVFDWFRKYRLTVVIEDYLDDHTFLVKFEDQLKEYINDDDIDGCQQFYHFQNIRNRVATNAEIFENKNGIESIRVNEIAARTFFKNISVTKKENENEE